MPESTVLWDDQQTWHDTDVWGAQTTGTVTITYTPAPGTTPLSLTIASQPPVTAQAAQVAGLWTFTFVPPADGDYLRTVLVQGATGTYDDRGRISFNGGQVSSSNIPPWTPSAARVAALIPRRTQPQDGSGVSTGTFSAATLPTAKQVDMLAQAYAREVELATGGLTLPADLTDSAADVAAYGTAAQVESTYYNQTDSRYDELWERYRTSKDNLVAGVIARRDAESIPGDGAADLPPSPRGSFPPPMTYLLERW